jgi:hypothetical protein
VAGRIVIFEVLGVGGQFGRESSPSFIAIDRIIM